MNTEKSSWSFANKRIESDLNEINKNISDTPIIFVDSSDNDLLHLDAAILGPDSTPYENGVFLLEIELSEQFPYSPPRSIIFKRATMHPNVDEYGKFMSDLLKPESWSPALTIKDILEHIWVRLAIPDIDSNECDLTRAYSYKTDKERFETLAREYSIKYAKAS